MRRMQGARQVSCIAFTAALAAPVIALNAITIQRARHKQQVR